MPASAQHFQEGFQPHSRHKHLILQEYIRGWTRKLLLRHNAGNRLRLVDACAGPGYDGQGNPGSPVIAAAAAAEARIQLAGQFGRDVRIDVTAIEKKASYHRELQRHLHPFGDSVIALRGTLGDHIERLEADGVDVPTFYFIDPFGLEPLQAAVIRRALSRVETEAFLLFSDQAALRHFGAVQSIETRAVERFRRHDGERQSSLFPELELAFREELQAKAVESQKAQEMTRERAIEILDAAFGDRHWLTEIERTPADQRRQRFLELYREFLVDAGVPYVLAVPMLDADGAHVYFLVHATRAPAGHELMKATVEYALKRSPLPREVVDALRDLIRIDPEPVAAFLRERFAGQTIRWARDKEYPNDPCLREVVLGETALYPFQAKELQSLLAPYRLPGRTVVYRFPV